MTEYMKTLRDKVGYVSMKIKFAEKPAKMFPSMLGVPGEKSSEEEVQKAWSVEEDEHVDGEQGKYANILTPIEEKDKIIKEQEIRIKNLLGKQSELQSDETFTKVEAENNTLKEKLKIYEKKLLFTRKATEQKILESISNESFYREDPHLVCVLSTTLNEDEFDFIENDANEVTEPTEKAEITHRSRKDLFMSSIEDKVDKSNQIQQERLNHIKDQVLEKIKSTKINKMRNRTSSDSKSTGSKRRLPPSDDEKQNSCPSPSRPRTDIKTVQ